MPDEQHSRQVRLIKRKNCKFGTLREGLLTIDLSQLSSVALRKSDSSCSSLGLEIHKKKRIENEEQAHSDQL